MKNLFCGYHKPTQDDFKHLWDNAIISFDTNILLHLYRYSDSTTKHLLDILKKLKDRAWLTHQCVKEFYSNRLKVILDMQSKYEEISSLGKTTLTKLSSEISEKANLHPLIDKEEFASLLSKFEKDFLAKVEDAQRKHPNYLERDPILKTLFTTFEGRVGAHYDDATLKQIFKEGEDRYAKEIPPGYMDSRGPNKKTGDDQYGDLVLWKQLIDLSKTHKKPLIFATDDTKADWWIEYRGRTIGPRQDLLDEFFRETNEIIYIYQPKPFMRYASEHLKTDIKEETFNEVEMVTESTNASAEMPASRQDVTIHLDRPLNVKISDDYNLPLLNWVSNVIIDKHLDGQDLNLKELFHYIKHNSDLQPDLKSDIKSISYNKFREHITNLINSRIDEYITSNPSKVISLFELLLKTRKD